MVSTLITLSAASATRFPVFAALTIGTNFIRKETCLRRARRAGRADCRTARSQCHSTAQTQTGVIMNTPALNDYYRFKRAARLYEQAIKTADSAEIDLRREDVGRCAQGCEKKGLPEPLLTEIFGQLSSLDKYRAARQGASAKRPPEAPTSKRARGRRPEKFEKAKSAMLSALSGEITPAELRDMKEKQLTRFGDFSRDILRKARQAALAEFVGNSNSHK